MSDTRLTPFTIAVPDSVLEDLRDRLARTRFPDEVNDGDWGWGTDLDYLKELCEYWRDGFDWRAREADLNRLPQFTTPIDGLELHFVHAPSPEPQALPLVITHGWPGSFVEFERIVEPLRDPAAHGADPGDAFHVVCPSIPGYGFSQAASTPGMTPRRVAELVAALMARLGYDRFGAQGGDWGSLISSLVGEIAPEQCAGVHLNMPLARPPKDPTAGVSAQEQEFLARSRLANRDATGYQRIQGSKPQTLGVGLNDSPAGLASWIVEKFRAWSDCGGDLERSFTKDQLLTNITLYWVTGTITSSTRLYYEANHSSDGASASAVPTGVAVFPGEPVRPPRAWVEAQCNLVHWSPMPRGGHFAAMEEPELLVEDVRTFFRSLR